MTLTKRLADQFEQRICRVCVHETATGGCTLTRDRECPIFQWAEQLAEVVAGVNSDLLADYMDDIQAIICPECHQDDQGECTDRAHLNCPLDLYLGIVVEVLEQELSACRGKDG